MKKIFILGICATPFFFASCGGGEADGETTDSDSTAVEEVVEVQPVVTSYTVDTANTVINWMTYEGEEVGHSGTIGALNGTFELTTTGEEVAVSGGSMTMDINSITSDSEKLTGHLMAPDFFDVNNFATAGFTFDSYEEGVIYGTANIIGKDIAVEMTSTISSDDAGATIEIAEFKLDFAGLEMPFFVTEAAEAPEDERHDTHVGFTATVAGTTAE